MDNLRKRIISVLNKKGGELTTSKVAAAVYSPIRPVRRIIRDLVNEGIVEREEKQKTNEVKYTRHIIKRIIEKEKKLSNFKSLYNEMSTKTTVASMAKETDAT